MKKVILLIGTIYCSVISQAQSDAFGYFEDALRFSKSNYSLGSSARMQAIGGAQISLGGDISSAASNPAGLGFFNKSVFTFSPSVHFSDVSTDYFINGDINGIQGSTESDNNHFNIANIGAVINWNKGRFSDQKFKGGTLAISINRANNYRLDRSYEGENNFNSLADALADRSFNIEPNNLPELAYAAFDQYLISPITDENSDLVYVADFEGFPVQNEVIEERGSHYQMNVAWGGNYDDRLYFGGGMGVQFINYRQQRIYQEFDFGTFNDNGEFIPDPDLNDFTLIDDLDVSGAGVNFNFGVIARPVNFITVGISYTSPSFLSLNEESFLDLDAGWKVGATADNDGEIVDLSTIDPYQGTLFISDYNLRTPSRLGLGATLFLGKKGFLSGDAEFIDYGDANLSSDDFSTSGDNQVIEDIYSSVMNVRLGGEYRINKFMLRAGYAFFPSPYQNSDLNEQTDMSFGFGYRNAHYFLDLGVVNSTRTIEYIPYQSLDEFQPVASSEIENTIVTITFGLNF
ncbi:MAG: hypothetical protein AAF620_00610 [Bacteroidota bacterium]